MRDLQLTGDELLMWTIETFNAFYPQTFAQKYFIPLMGLFPLLLSIATFVYDYYSGFATDGFFSCVPFSPIHCMSGFMDLAGLSRNEKIVRCRLAFFKHKKQLWISRRKKFVLATDPSTDQTLNWQSSTMPKPLPLELLKKSATCCSHCQTILQPLSQPMMYHQQQSAFPLQMGSNYLRVRRRPGLTTPITWCQKVSIVVGAHTRCGH